MEYLLTFLAGTVFGSCSLVFLIALVMGEEGKKDNIVIIEIGGTVGIFG